MEKTAKLEKCFRMKHRFRWTAIITACSSICALSAINAKTFSEATYTNRTPIAAKTLDYLQQQSVIGTVTNGEGLVLPGVSIIIEGTQNGVQTDFDGNYSIDAQQGDVLVFSYLGFKTQKATVGQNAIINISMEDDVSVLDEVVVIGYGTQKKGNLTAAIATVDTRELENRPVNSLTEMLTASTPGLNINIGNSAFDQNPNINLRGFTGIDADGDITSGSPLIIIDGVPLDDPNDLKLVNPQDVESISILKDASATAIYGSRAPNGAILITTKSGKKGQKLQVNYSSEVRISSPLGLPKTALGSEFAYGRNNRFYNLQGTPTYDDEVISRILAFEAGELTTTGVVLPNGKYGDVFSFNSSQDNYDIAFRDNVFNLTNNVSLSGGSDNTSYFVSFNSLDAQGVYNTDLDKMKRYITNARINTDVNKWLNIGINNKYSRQTTTLPTISNNQNNRDQNFFQLLGFPPTIPVYYDNGTPNTFSIIPNLDGIAGQYENVTDVMTTQVTAQIKPFNGFTINTDYTWRLKNQFDKDVELAFGGFDNDGTFIESRRDPGINSINEVSREETYHTANFNIDYKKSFGKHNLNTLVGYNEEEYSYRALRGENTNFYSNEIQSLQSTFGENPIATDDRRSWATQGYFGRFHYDFDEKYLLDLSGRYDASSRFAPDSRWAFFPSISAGYNIAKEKFWPIKDYVNHFKFTFQYGRSGNQGAADVYSYLPTLEAVNQIETVIDGGLPTAVRIPEILADDNTWAKPTNIGFGIEIGILKDKLTTNYNWYQTTTYDQIGPAIQLPEALGTDPPFQNNTVTERRGWEFNINWQDQFNIKGDLFSYGIRAGLSDYIGYVVDYEDNELGLRNEGFVPGQIFGEVYGVKSAGIAQNDAEVLQNVLRRVNGEVPTDLGWYVPGDLFFVDSNGDGLSNSGIGSNRNGAGPGFWYSEGDRERLGFNYPRYQYNIAMNAEYKGFALSLLFQGVGHQKVYWSNRLNFGDFNFLSQEQLERGYWTENSTDAFLPRRYSFQEARARTNVVNDQYLNNLAHLRIKNIGLSYSLPQDILSKLSLRQAVITLSGENLGFIFNKSWTPEFDPISIATNQGRTYPPSRTISLGFRVGI